jgi:two-component system, NarL family, nitrate/nitrite response regulator NarL
MSRLYPLRLLVAEHQPRFRDALQRLLDSEPGLAVVAQCVNIADTLRLAEQHRPDVLLLDLDMPDGAGFDTLKRLAALPQRVRTLGLSKRVHAEIVLHALSLGARGVIEKHAPKPILFKSIRTVADGHYYAGPDHLDILIEASRTLIETRRAPLADVAPQSGCTGDPKRFRLTRRELDIVAGITIGESNKEIADRLLLKECTVKHHVASAFDKLGVFSRLQLAVFAIHHQLVNVTEALARSGS